MIKTRPTGKMVFVWSLDPALDKSDKQAARDAYRTYWETLDHSKLPVVKGEKLTEFWLERLSRADYVASCELEAHSSQRSNGFIVGATLKDVVNFEGADGAPLRLEFTDEGRVKPEILERLHVHPSLFNEMAQFALLKSHMDPTRGRS